MGLRKKNYVDGQEEWKEDKEERTENVPYAYNLREKQRTKNIISASAT